MGKLGASRFCVVDRSWTEETAKLHTCSDGSHRHLGWKEINELWTLGFLEPMRAPGAPRPIDEPDYVFEWLIPGRIIQFKRMAAIRGLSCKVGATHAMAVEAAIDGKDKGNWALAMLASIRMRRESPRQPRLLPWQV